MSGIGIQILSSRDRNKPAVHPPGYFSLWVIHACVISPVGAWLSFGCRVEVRYGYGGGGLRFAYFEDIAEITH